MIPGEILTAEGDIVLNDGRETVVVKVANSGDRPVQVGSHYHFYETNEALEFEREKARGHRLDIPAGTAVRFEPVAGSSASPGTVEAVLVWLGWLAAASRSWARASPAARWGP